ncbi:hypothetical protein BV378_36555 [Nostoc sp. RF31YmG]|nr:hypothetical protein BV378_36555 [Nostoc sp. RF31YmG]
MSALTDALDRILAWLQQYRPSHVSLLQPGLTAKEIEEIIADMPLQLTQDIRELYQWRNGSRIIGEYKEFAWTFEFFSFYPLQIVVNGYLDRAKREKVELFGFEHPNALNIFLSVEPTDIGYVFIEEQAQEAAPVVFEYCKGGGCNPIIKYSSLTNMMLTIAEIYENADDVDTYGNFTIDSEKAITIWRKYNAYRITELALIKLKGELSLELLLEIETGLIQAKHPMAVEPLLHILQQPMLTDEDFAPQHLAMTVLGELGDVRAVDILIYSLQNRYCRKSYYAAKSLGKLKDNRAVTPLIEALQNSNDWVRRMVIWALGEIKDTRAIEPLSQLTNDQDNTMQEAAIRALNKIRYED